jgi:aminoglycoside phosphotransferase (APT) family kinase protein
MSTDPDLLAQHAPILRSLRVALRTAAAAHTDPQTARDLLALCDTVLLRLQCSADPTGARPPDPDALARLREHCRGLQARDAEACAAAGSQLRALMDREALRLEGYEAAVTRAAEAQAAAPLQVSTSAVGAYLLRHFPERKIELRRCTEIRGGRSKVTLMLELADAGSTSAAGTLPLPSELVIRCDRPGSAQATTVCDEFPVLEAMYRAGASAPEPLWLERDPGPLGAPFLAMRRMPGSTRGDYWNVGSATAAHARALAQALARIHGVDARSAWPAAAATARESVAALLTRHETSWRALSFPSMVLECGYAWLHAQLRCLTGPSVPVHGDVHFANVLFEGVRISCLTDWEFAHAGHAAEDLAFCRNYIERVLPWVEFIAAYTAAGGHNVSDQELRFFGVWTYLRNATLGAIALRSVLGSDTPDIRTVAIALHSRARLEASLARTLATELADSPEPRPASQ